MHILAVDTTSAHASVALLADGELLGVLGFRTARAKHAEQLLPSVDYLLVQAESSLGQLDGFAVAVGPGSFTGLRVGIATVEGLAYTLGLPVVGVSALEATAHRYRYRRGKLVAFLDAYRGDVYAACFRSDGESLVPLDEPVCIDPEDFLRALEASSERPELIAGNGTLRHDILLRSRMPDTVTIAEPSFFLAEDVARIGAGKLARGERAPLGGLDALYLRAPEAERQREKGV